jgi:hypothetical protein
MMVRITFDSLKIDEITNSSGVFYGDNIEANWKAFLISNEGYGELDGDYNKSSYNSSFIIKTQPKDMG